MSRAEQGKPAPRSRGARLVGGASLLVLLAAALWALLGGGVKREAGLNVLLITVDTLRSDAVGSYGNGRGTTPWLDRLAARGVRFTRAHAHNVLTLPSHANILSGRYPFDHGVRENAGFRFPAGVPTLATLLKAQGYRTGAFVSGFPVDSRFGLDSGFDLYEDSFADGRSAVDFRLPERVGTETVRLAERWIGSGAGTPWFAWVHLYDPHTPYRPPEPFASRFGDSPYLGEVAAADDALRVLLEPLLEAGRESRTLVVFTADHGEGLGDHGEKTHGFFAYETTLHVPLVLYAPRLLPARVVDEPARHVDIVPTVLDALTLPVPADLPGRSLLPVVEGKTLPVQPSYFEALSGMLTRGWAPLYGVVRGGHKYVDLPLPELYDLDEDPDETDNRIALEPERLETLRGALARFRAEDGGIEQREESAETRQQLAALGYISSASTPLKEVYTEEDDPKNLIDLDARMQDVIALQLRGDLAGALEACREVVGRRPQMNAGWVQLALVHKKLGDLGEAIRVLRRALEQEPDNVGNAVLLATSLTEAGDPAEAAELLGVWSEQPEPNQDVLVTRGVALAQLGRSEEALAQFRRARKQDPSNPMTLVQIATVHLTQGRLAEARFQLEAALQLNPEMGLAHHTLGLVAVREGDEREAERRFRRAVELDPSNYDALLNLGSLLVRRGESEQAAPLLQRFAATAPPDLYAPQIAQVRRLLARIASGG